jgi:predicted GH43/DUF377 family glycosyl hydrolase
MKWRKCGQVYAANGERPWAQSHAYIPTPVRMDEKTIRVYAAFLDREKVGRVGFVDVDAAQPTRILRVSREPVLDIGLPGTFDDNGVSPLSAVCHQGKIYLYYVGWQLGHKVRYFLLTGLAVGDGETFTRWSRTPVLERSDEELFVRSGSHVLNEGDHWTMWYVASSTWVDVGGKRTPTYNVRRVTSPDGGTWGRSGQVCIDLDPPDEYGFGRPFVFRRRDGYQMWYSIRTFSKGYRMGYAESPDGVCWERHDDRIGLEPSPSGWDSEMVCFGAVLPVNGQTYMFYNGNNYGETGFGVAVLES